MFAKFLVVLCSVVGFVLSKRLHANLGLRHDLSKISRSDGKTMHEVVFSIKLRNLDSLKKTVEDISSMHSPNYGKYLSRAQISELTANSVATNHLLGVLGLYPEASILKHSRDGRFITVQAPIAIWEKLFSCEFYSFERVDRDGVVDLVVNRAVNYEIPSLLADHVQAVFNTVQMPPISKTHQKIGGNGLYTVRPGGSLGLNPPPDILNGYVTPQLLNSFYNIANNNGAGLGTQSLYESINQTYSPDDLTGFQENFDLILEGISQVIGGHNSSTFCVDDPGDCMEANLDVQFIMAVAENVPTIYYYDTSDDFLLTWAQDLLEMDNPPLVNSISYIEYEDILDAAYLNEFENSAALLSAQGVTIVAASGDDGVAGFFVRGNASWCGYYPMWPASSPYVLAIGGTQGPESGLPEVSCTSDGGGVITSGGGFSNYFAMPSWQEQAVAGGYFSTISISGDQPAPGYNNSGRGYPDVSSLGYNYTVLIGNVWRAVSGTSASTPVTAGFVSLINSARFALNMPALGWINKIVYESYGNFSNDITAGENNCGAGHNPSTVTCCEQGFTAVTGWDPVTGFGSVNYAGFASVFLPPTDDDDSTDDDSSGNGDNGLSKDGVIAVAVCGGVVGAGALGAAAYYGLFASKSSIQAPLLSDSGSKA